MVIILCYSHKSGGLLAMKLTLLPTPFKGYNPDFKTDSNARIKYKRDYDKKSVQKFATYILQNYPNGFAAYELSKDLDVHRVVVEEWIYGLEQTYLIKARSKALHGVSLVVYSIDTVEYTRQTSGKIRAAKIKIDACTDYDPWTNRDYDKYFYDCWFPYRLDDYVYKYYSIYRNEPLAYTGEYEIINGNLFVPPINKRDDNDHPLFFDYSKKEIKKAINKKTKRFNPPPKTQKEDVERACLCQQKRSGVITDPGYLKSWFSGRVYLDVNTIDRPNVSTGKTAIKKSGKTIKLKVRKRSKRSA